MSHFIIDDGEFERYDSSLFEDVTKTINYEYEPFDYQENSSDFINIGHHIDHHNGLHDEGYKYETFDTFSSKREPRFKTALSEFLETPQKWSFINPKGDGNCLLWALASILLDDTPELITGDIKDIMMIKFIEGVRRMGKEVPNDYVMVDTFERGVYKDLLIFSHNDSDVELGEKFISLLDQDNIGIGITKAFAFAFNVNIACVIYDEISREPFQQMIFQVPHKYEDVEGHKILIQPRYRFILSTAGHNFSMVPHEYTVSEYIFNKSRTLASFSN